MIIKTPTEQELQEAQEQELLVKAAQARTNFIKDLTDAITDEYTPIKQQLQIELMEIGRTAFTGKHSLKLEFAIHGGRTDIQELSRKLAKKTLYWLEKQTNEVDYSKVKIKDRKLIYGKIEQPIYFIETFMFTERGFSVRNEEPKKREPDPREQTLIFERRLTKEIQRFTKEFRIKIKSGNTGLYRSQIEGFIDHFDRVMLFTGRFASEAMTRLAGQAIPIVGNITDCREIKINYDEVKDEITLQGRIVGEWGSAEFNDIPVEYMGRTWHGLTSGERSLKWPVSDKPIYVTRSK